MSIFNDAIYDGFSFRDNGIVLTEIDHMTMAQRNNQIEPIANENGGVLVQSLLGTKPVALQGEYTGTDAIDAQNMYDTLTQMLNRQERLLQVPHAGSYRRYIATPQNIIISNPNGLNRLTFSFEFVVPKGYAEDENPTVLVDVTQTTANASIPISVLGSNKARPYITLTLTSVTGGTGATISFRNAANFIGLTITGNFVSGDVIIIDSANFQIYVNSTLTAPVGRLPVWNAGAGSIYYSDTFTARSVHIYGTYYPKNL